MTSASEAEIIGVFQERARLPKRSNLSRAALPNATTDALPSATADAVALGQEAWQRRKGDARACWADWLLIGEALEAGRERAMTEAKTTKPVGKRYNLAYHAWLDRFGLADIDKSDRAKLLLILAARGQVEAWRASLTEAQRANLNHPSAV